MDWSMKIVARDDVDPGPTAAAFERAKAFLRVVIDEVWRESADTEETGVCRMEYADDGCVVSINSGSREVMFEFRNDGTLWASASDHLDDAARLTIRAVDESQFGLRQAAIDVRGWLFGAEKK